MPSFAIQSVLRLTDSGRGQSLYGIITTPILMLSTFLLLASLSLPAYCDIVFKRIGQEQGLPSNTIWTTKLDYNGNLWIATTDGLAWYDGKEIQVITTDSQLITGLDNNHTRNINLFADGSIWVATPSGVNVLKNNSTEFSHPAALKTAPDSIHSSVELSDSTALLLGSNGVYLVHKDTLALLHFIPTKAIGEGREMLTLGGDQIIFTTLGIFKWQPSSNSFANILMFEDKVDVSHVYVTQISTSEALITRRDSARVYHFSYNDKPTLRRLNKHQSVTQPLRARKSALSPERYYWVASYGGLQQLNVDDQRAGKTIPIVDGDNAARAVYDFLITQQGELVLSTNNGVYIGSEKHLDIWRFTVPDSGTFSLVKDQTDHLWLAGAGKGLYKFDPSLQLVDTIHYKNQQGEAPTSGISALSIDKDNILWLAGSAGVHRFDINKGRWLGKVEVYRNPSCDDVNLSLFPSMVPWPGRENTMLLSGKTIAAASVTPLGEIQHKLPCYQSRTIDVVGDRIVSVQRNTLYSHSNDFSNVIEYTNVDRPQVRNPALGGLVSFGANQLFTIGQGGMWHVLESAEKLQQVDSPLRNYTLLNHVKSEFGHFVATTKGLLGVKDLQSVPSRIYSRFDGIRATRFLVDKPVTLPDGRLVYPTYSGMLAINPARISRHEDQPILSISRIDMKADNGQRISKIYRPNSQRTAEQIHLPHNTARAELWIAATNQLYKPGYVYEYKIAQSSFDNWQPLSKSTSKVILPNLDSGDFTLTLRVKSPSGFVSQPQRVLNIRIAPNPWLAWYAMLSYLLIASALIVMIIKWRSRHLHKRNMQLQDMVDRQVKEIKRQANQLEKTLQEKQTLFTNISHEFRTPLTLIKGNAESWLRGSDPQNKRYFDYIQQSSERLLGLVDQLLLHRRLEKPNEQLKFRAKPNPIVTSICSSFLPLCESKNITLTQKIADEGEVLVISDMLEIIVSNLISNALKYTLTGGRIDVTTIADKNTWQLTVEDNGIGIDEKDLKLITEPFSRFNSKHPSTRHVEGTGIGLHLVNKIIGECQGTLKITSEPGKGTSVVVTLPLFSAENRSVSIPEYWFDSEALSDEISRRSLPLIEKPVSHHAKTAKTKTQILICEDDDALRALLVDILQDKFNLLTAKDGEEAWLIAQNELPDMLLSDLMMPNMNGFELLDKIKGNELTCHIPVLLLTAVADELSQLKTYQMHVDDYIVKPFEQNMLLARIDAVLHNRKVRQQNFRDEHLEGNVELSDTATISPKDRKFLDNFDKVLQQHLTNSSLTIADLSQYLFLSESQIRRKIAALTGLTPVHYIRRLRLKNACDMLLQDLPLKHVAIDCGFSNQSHFGRHFKQEFGMTPKQWLLKHAAKEVKK